MKHSDEKLKNFQKFLKKDKISAFAVTDLDSVNFLSDFTFVGQGDAMLLITPAKAFCFTKEMYIIDLKKKTPYLTLINSLDPKDIVKQAAGIKAKNCVFDPSLIDYINGTAFFKAGFKEMAGYILKTRQVKTAQEIKKIRSACRISFKAYEIFKTKIKTGMSEIEAAKMLGDIMTSLGGQGLAFDTIMAFGPNGANPHHINSHRKLKNNEPVLMDFGCKYEGYCSDITRTFWHGNKPSKEFVKIFDIVKKAHDITFKAAKAGMTAGELDGVCRSYIEKVSGLSKYFIHSTGHSLGTKIHETPILRGNVKDILSVDNIFTIEPGLYFEGKLGIRYENTVHLTKQGAKILTKN